MTIIEELNKKINPRGIICGKSWCGEWCIQGSYDPKQVEGIQIKGIHTNLGNFDTLTEMENYINETFK